MIFRKIGGWLWRNMLTRMRLSWAEAGVSVLNRKVGSLEFARFMPKSEERRDRLHEEYCQLCAELRLQEQHAERLREKIKGRPTRPSLKLVA